MNSAKKEIEVLVRESNTLTKEINKLKQRLSSQNNNLREYYSNQLKGKELFLRKIKEKLEAYNIVCSTNPVHTNNIVDLYSQDNSIEGKYIVSTHNDKTIVGIVGFRKDACFDDNVFYNIDKEYQNKGLGFQAVSTLLEYLSLNNVTSVTFYIDKANAASIKVAEKIKEIYPNCKIEDLGHTLSYHFTIKQIEKTLT